MKTHNLSSAAILTLAACILTANPASADTVKFTSSGTFTPPAGVTNITVECWGGGGAGGSAQTTASVITAGGGAGGGAYAKKVNIPVTPGTLYTITIPAAATAPASGFATGDRVNGANITFSGDGAVSVTANGGQGGACAVEIAGSTTRLGVGGTAGSGLDAAFAGGSGQSTTVGGIGGSAASDTGNGVQGSTATRTGSDTDHSGGGGGSGVTGSNNGGAGAAPGGGGGGGRRQTTGIGRGGAGGKGQIIINYTVPLNFKANNALSLNDPASWTAFVPTGSVAEWNNLVLGANTTSLGGNLTFSGIRISDPGGLVTIDTGNTLTLGAAPVDLDLSAATQDLALNCNLALGAANVWDVTTGRTLTLGGTVSGAFAVTKQGAGTAILQGALNSWTGTTTVSAGTLKLAAPAVIPDGTGNGNVALTGTLDLNGNNESINGLSGAGVVDNAAGSTASTLTVGGNNQTSSFSGVLQNSGSSASLNLTKTGTGTLTLSGTNTYTGATTVNGGVLLIGGNSALNGTSGITVNGTTGNALSIDSGITVGSGKSVTINGAGPSTAWGALTSNGGTNEWQGNVTIGSASTRIGINSASASTFTLSGVIDSGANPHGLIFRIQNSTNSIVLTNANTYLGDTWVITNGGLIKLSGGANRLPVTTKLIIGSSAVSGILDLNGQNQEVAGISVGQTSGTFTNELKSAAAATLTVNTATPSVYSGLITGDVILTKTGADTLTLSGANTYTGATNVDNGTLLFSTAGTGVSDVSVDASASAGALVAATNGQFVSTGDLAFANNSVLTIDYGSTTPSTTVAPIKVDNFTVGTGLSLLLDGDNLAGLTVSQAYPLVTWTTSGPADGSAFTAVLNPRIQGTFSVDTVNKLLLFTVSANTTGSPISWKTGNGTWDTGTPNWADATPTPTTYFDTFDAVLFGDAAGATGNPIVTLSSAFSPDGVTMNSTAHDYTISGTGSIGGNSSLTLDAANTRTMTLATANTYTGATAVNGGTLRLGDGGTDGSLAATGAISIGTGATFAVNQSDTVTQGTEFSTAAISGAGGLAQTGSGTTILNAVNTYTGPTTISGGILQIGGAGRLGAGAYAGDIAISGGAALQYASTAAQTLSGIISGNGTLTKSGVSTLTLSGANSYSGATTISAGVLSLGHLDALQNTSGITIAGGATLVTTTDAITIGAPITTGLTSTTSTISFGRASAAAGSLTLNGAIGGAGNVSFTTPDVSSGGNVQTIFLGAAGTYAGSTLISTPNTANSVTVMAGVANALPATTVLTLSGGSGSGSGRTVAYDLGGFDQTLAGLTNSISTITARNQRVTNSGTLATLTINNSTAYTYGGTGISSSFNGNPVNPTAQITGAIALTKDGAGTFTLAAGAGNSFTGATKITEGILSLGHSTSIQNSPLDTLSSIAGDATNGLQTTVTALTIGGLTGNKNLADVFTTTAGGYDAVTALTLNPGTGATPSYSGGIANGAAGMTLTKSGAGTQTLTGANTYTGATAVNVGTLALVGGSLASPVTVATGASLGFTLGSPTISTSTFDLSAGTIKITGTPTLPSYTLITSSTGITGTPTLDAAIPGYQLEVVGGNVLNLVQQAGYASWASINAIGSNPDQDKDGDGVSNAVEYVLGGDVNTNDLSKLPTVDASGANLVFSFKRDRDSIDGTTTIVIEVGTTLATWPDTYNVGTTTLNSTAGVTVAENSPVGFDTITLTVPKGTDPKKFAHLKVSVTP